MIDWFAYALVAVALVVGLGCIAIGLAGRVPSDLTMGGLLLVELGLVAQVVIAVVAPAVGNHPSGSVLEFWVYLISALLLPLVAGFWALLERTRWSTVILGVAALAVAVMEWRMLQIWTVQLA
ncbi:hypothetical protein [Agromyces seonyuensis]|uniref:Integral membrane protein n=1 Tax=Agromyces seonyuensis TaxID=2662446 RepID=A0A6I4NZP9_9MICO|nr:hypothetical protein [Agromyces seonyuensis]MWB99758.1 hypothetical protein [Agromyces seonyuensis]